MRIPVDAGKRLELFKVLGEPMRLRVLAAAAEEELAIGELAELLGESQPNVSRHVAPLRKLGLLAERRQGTRVLVRLADEARADAVVHDGIVAGRALCEPEGTLDRIAELVRRRDAPAREFFARDHRSLDSAQLADELPAYVMALWPLLPRRELALDLGTGEGRLLDLLAPLFKHVIAVDREPAQLERAKQRAAARGYDNVHLMTAELDDPALHRAAEAEGLADVAFASRVLHHAPRPAEALSALARMVRPGGAVVVIDYAAHDDETMRTEQADLWLGFAEDELHRYARDAGLSDVTLAPIPQGYRGSGPDRHLSWRLLTARRGDAPVGHRTE